VIHILLKRIRIGDEKHQYMFISFILPCHNEEQAIPLFLPKVIQARNTLLKTKNLKGFEIFVIDDGSTDQSLEKLEQYKKEIQIISLKTQEGYGSAIKKGIKQAQGDWLVFCDLDGTCEPEELGLFIDLACNKSLPVVWGNRLNKTSQMPFIRRLGNRLYQLAFLLLSLEMAPDVCSGFRLFRKSALTPQIYEFPSDLSFSLALTAHCIHYGIPFASIDISYRERLGQSKLHPVKDGLIFLHSLIKFLFFKKRKK